MKRKKKVEMKLYEFSAFISVHTVIAAESEQAAREEISLWEKGAWLANGDAMDEVCDPELFDVRDPTYPEDLKEEAHVVVSHNLAEARRKRAERTAQLSLMGGEERYG